MIQSTMDLLVHFGAKDEETLSRRVYKATECGAWASLVPPGPIFNKKAEVWTAKMRPCIGGCAILHARKKGEAVTLARDLPREVLDYLDSPEGMPHRSRVSDAFLSNLRAEDGGDILKVTRKGQTTYVTFKVEVSRQVGAHCGGVVFGSIVEGSDAEVMPEELRFPFSTEDLDRVIENIEDEADCIWREANT